VSGKVDLNQSYFLNKGILLENELD